MEDKTISQMLSEIIDQMCNNYCKYPDLWDEEAEGIELMDSEHCRNCPLNRI